jgi:uncharacterized circularly permuted ATP-grasp superfamily protein
MSALSAAELADRQRTLEQSFLLQGITFTVYGAGERHRADHPTDLFPRIIPATEWAQDRGRPDPAAEGAERLPRRHLRRAEDPRRRRGAARLVLGAPSYRREMQHLYVPHNAYVNVSGADLIRGEDGGFVCWRTICACPPASPTCWPTATRPSAPSPAIFRRPGAAGGALSRPAAGDAEEHGPDWRPDPQVVVLTPGVYNSAYYEHAYLARLMGVPLVEGRDLVVHDNLVYMRTTRPCGRVDVIYRRVDDDFIDP